MVRVDLGGEEYGRDEFYLRNDRGAYEIPLEQFDRWEATTAAYQAMQAEISALTEPELRARKEAAILRRSESDAQYAAKARALIDAHDNTQAREEAQR